MNFNRGDYVVFSYGIYDAITGRNKIVVGEAMGSTMVKFQGTRGYQKAKPVNVFGVFVKEESAIKCQANIEPIWETHNKVIAALRSQLKDAVKIQIEDCQDRLIG